jgi:hypothetical protein
MNGCWASRGRPGPATWRSISARPPLGQPGHRCRQGLERLLRQPAAVSHDRWFLDRIATHILAFEGDSRVVWFEGNYSDYEADRRRRLGEAVDHPHRIKYRQLTRQ